MKDLYHQDVVEMVERETRQFELTEIVTPEDPSFDEAFQALWGAFGASDEMERREAVIDFLRDDPYAPTAQGTFIRYFLIVARDREGRLCGVRDGTVLVNPRYAADLCVVNLAHLYIEPHARGTVVSYWLRIAPVDIAVEFLAGLHARGAIDLPSPTEPHRHYGLRMDLVAEMEYFDPEDPRTWRRLLFYGRGGFDVIDPRHFPYLQPDLRDPEVIRDTGNRPLPYMMLVRRMGRERQATMSIGEARAIVRLLYDDFAVDCAPDHLEQSLQLVLDRLEERLRRKPTVDLLPLPTGARDLRRLRRLFRFDVYRRSYRGSSPVVEEHLREAEARVGPGYLERALAGIAEELEQRPRWVYASRDRDTTWDDTPVSVVRRAV